MQVLNITNNFSSKRHQFIDEEISDIIVSNSFGGVTLDFSNFKFNRGDLHIQLQSSLGSVTIITNRNTKVDNRILSFIAANNSTRINQETYEHTIILEGKSNIGQLTIQEVY